MSMELCNICHDPSTYVDTDYHVEIYRHGFDHKGNWTGKEDDACAMCEGCLSSALNDSNIDEENWHDNYG